MIMGRTRKVKAGKGIWDEIIGSVHNSPLYSDEEEAWVSRNVKEAESMTWAELKAQAEAGMRLQ